MHGRRKEVRIFSLIANLLYQSTDHLFSKGGDCFSEGAWQVWCINQGWKISRELLQTRPQCWICAAWEMAWGGTDAILRAPRDSLSCSLGETFVWIEAAAKPSVPHEKCHHKKKWGSWRKPEARDFSNRHGRVSGLLRLKCQSHLWLDVDWGKSFALKTECFLGMQTHLMWITCKRCV